MHESEVLQVAAAAELVVALRIAVVHQYVVVAAYQPEHARPLHRILARFLQVAELGGVRPCQLLGRGPHHPLPRAEAVVYRWQALVFEEKHILAVAPVVDNVAVDGRRAEVEQQPWLGDVGEVVVDIAVEQLEVRLALVAHGVFPVVPPDGVVYHVAALAPVPDELRRPHGVQVVAAEALERREARGEVDGRVLPVQQVVALHQYQSVVALPSFRRPHVGHHHVERAPVAAPADVRVAYALLQRYGVRCHHRAPPVERSVVQPVVAQGIAHLLAIRRVVGEECKEIAAVLLVLPGGQCRPGRRCHQGGRRGRQSSPFHTVMLGFGVSASARPRPAAVAALRAMAAALSVSSAKLRIFRHTAKGRRPYCGAA